MVRIEFPFFIQKGNDYCKLNHTTLLYISKWIWENVHAGTFLRNECTTLLFSFKLEKGKATKNYKSRYFGTDV